MVENGVKDYSLEEFLSDVKVSIIEQLVQILTMVTRMNPAKMIQFLKNFSGEEKTDGFMKLLEQGMMSKPFILVTSLYVKNKDDFMVVK